ncbi:unnamed protein product [Rhizopus stolonifer]
MKPIDHSNMIMTLPEDEEDELEAQHICRPIIHSDISQGSYAAELEHKIVRLEQIIEELESEKDHILRQHNYRDNDVETLKKELKVKDEIVSQLEQDFMTLEDQLIHLQKELERLSIQNDFLSRSSIPQHLKRQSQLLMESKRRSLAIKDTHVLEQLLKNGGDLSEEYSSSCSNSSDEFVDNYKKGTYTSMHNHLPVLFSHHQSREPYELFTCITLITKLLLTIKNPPTQLVYTYSKKEGVLYSKIERKQ